MEKIKTLADLKLKQEKFRSQVELRSKASRAEELVQIKVEMPICGIASGPMEVMEFFVEELDKRNIEAVVTQTGCMGYCFAEPTIEVTLFGKDPVVFGYVDVKKADEIIERYIKTGELVDGIIPKNYESIN